MASYEVPPVMNILIFFGWGHRDVSAISNSLFTRRPFLYFLYYLQFVYETHNLADLIIYSNYVCTFLKDKRHSLL